MSRLLGKVAIVTGCAGERGIGRAVARRLAADGADLVLTDIAATSASGLPAKPSTGWRGLEAVAEEIQALGRRTLTARLDVRSAPQIDAVIQQTLASFGRLDILANNAASPPGADRVPVVELSEDLSGRSGQRAAGLPWTS